MVGLSSELVSRAAAALRGMGLLSEDATPQRAAEAAGQYAAQGGPFRPEGLLGGVTDQVAGGLVNTPRAMGFTGDPTNDINRMAQYFPTPMGGPQGPRMAGATAQRAGTFAPAAQRAAMAPPGMVHEKSRLDEETGDQWMEDPSLDGQEINISEMERSAQRYLDAGGDLPPGVDDVPGRVAEHIRRTSAGTASHPQIYKDMGMPFDIAEHKAMVELGYNQPAAAYNPPGSEVMVQGNRIRIMDMDPGEAFYKQLAQRNGGGATITPMRRPPVEPIDPRYAEFENLPKLSEAADMIWSPPRK